MRVKRIFIVLGITAIVIAFYGVYKLSIFSIFDDEFELIEEIKIPNKSYNLRVYYIPSNASSQSYIQVRKFKNNIEEILQNYKMFNYLNSYKVLGQDTLKLSISDTSQVGSKKEVKLKLPH